MLSALSGLGLRGRQALSVIVPGILVLSFGGGAVRDPGAWIIVSAVLAIVCLPLGWWMWKDTAVGVLRMTQSQRLAFLGRVFLYVACLFGSIWSGMTALS